MDYTTVDRVKTYLAITSTGAIDVLIGQLIPRECRLIDRYCGRTFGKLASTTKMLNGTGTSRLPLPETPVIAVTGITLCGTQAIPYEPTGRNTGFMYDDSMVYLNLGQRFPQGYANVQASWSSGYVFNDAGSVPAASPFEVVSVDARAVVDVAVTINGLPATKVSVPPSVSGTYQLDPLTGTFTFAAVDASAPYTISYVGIPPPIEQAAAEMVGLDLKQRDNLGINSKSLAGETISYSDAAMTKSTQALLNAYRRRWIP